MVPDLVLQHGKPLVVYRLLVRQTSLQGLDLPLEEGIGMAELFGQ
jgi:hypothetical protein